MQFSSSRLIRQPPAAVTAPIVYVVDGDHSIRAELEGLVLSAGWQVRSAGTADEFLQYPHVTAPGCLLLELNLPDLSGLELQRRVADRSEMPVVFLSVRPDLRLTVQAMKAGAFDFLVKPVENQLVVRTIEAAIEHSRTALAHAARRAALRERYESLSPREREVMELVVAGRLNKQVGGDLGIAEITVKAHRGNIMRKMHAASIVDLVNMAARLQPGVYDRSMYSAAVA
jgi:FixJ family two-component response regulator